MGALDIIQWTVLSLTALCIGMSKTGIQGMMLLVVPFMAMAFGAKESTGVILPMLCMADIMAVAYYKRIADWRIVLRLLPAAVAGFFLAIFTDKVIPPESFRKLMGWTLAFALAVLMFSSRTGDVRLSALDAEGQDGICRNQCVVLSRSQSPQDTTSDFRLGQHQHGIILAEPSYAPDYRSRSLHRNPDSQNPPGKSLPHFHQSPSPSSRLS